MSFPQCLTRFKRCHLPPAGFPHKECQSMLIAFFRACPSLAVLKFPVCQRWLLAMESTRCSFLLSSYSSLIHMPSPEELTCRRSTRELSGFFIHLKGLLRFQTIRLRVLIVNLTRHETLESYLFCGEKWHWFWAATQSSLVSKQILCLNKVHFKTEFVNKGHNLVFTSMFSTCIVLHITCNFDSVWRNTNNSLETGFLARGKNSVWSVWWENSMH